MEIEKILPILDGYLKRNQIHYLNIQKEINNFSKERDLLQTPIRLSQEKQADIQTLCELEKHRAWRQKRIYELKNKIEDLESKSNEAKIILKKTFGKIEAVKALISLESSN